MANACVACNGVGFGERDPDFGYRNSGKPCPKCNPNGDGSPPVKVSPRKAGKRRNITVQGVDGPVDPAAADEAGLTLEEAVEEGVFSEAEAEASLAEELSAKE